MNAPSERDNAGRQPGEVGIANSNQQHEVSATNQPLVKLDIPTAGTVKRAVFDALRRGERLTSNDALFRFGTSRLAAIVHKLQGEGWTIDSEIIPVSTASKRVAHVARYSMQEAA